MSKLFASENVADDSDGARVGGRPIVPAGSAWPSCTTCHGPLRFIVQHPLDDGKHVVAFQCENDPGMCDEWDPAKGGNLAMVVKGGAAIDPPEVTNPVKPTIDAVGLASSGTKEVGIFGGEPEWIQADETPTCCEKPMRFLLQLEESAHPQLNFCGGGAAYVFACSDCDKGAYIMQQ